MAARNYDPKKPISFKFKFGKTMNLTIAPTNSLIFVYPNIGIMAGNSIRKEQSQTSPTSITPASLTQPETRAETFKRFRPTPSAISSLSSYPPPSMGTCFPKVYSPNSSIPCYPKSRRINLLPFSCEIYRTASTLCWKISWIQHIYPMPITNYNPNERMRPPWSSKS